MQYMGMTELFASKALFSSGLKHQYEHIVSWSVMKTQFQKLSEMSEWFWWNYE